MPIFLCCRISTCRYTSYVCPFASTQCMVTDPNGRQYDLSSLAKSEDDQDANWSVAQPGQSGSNQVG